MLEFSKGVQKRFNGTRSISHFFCILITGLFFSMLSGAVDLANAATFKTLNGECVIEAENWTRRAGSIGGSWRVESQESGYNGSGYARGGLDESVKMTNGLESGYASMEYDIDFQETGRYYVHFRTYSVDHMDNGFYATLDGSEIYYGDRDAHYIYVRKLSRWNWYTRGYGHEQHIYAVSLDITSTGVKTFAVHRRDPGSRLDRIWLTKEVSAAQNLSTIALPSPSIFIDDGSQDPVENICDDGNDNDNDNRVDCDDPDCSGASACIDSESNCNDGNDNDNDNLVDCDDPDCNGAPACDSSPEPDISIYDSNGDAWDKSMDYGDIESGQSYDENIVITNRGTTDLQIIKIADSDPLLDPFRITSDPCSSTTLSPGEDCTVTVQFVPTSPGDFSDTFEIESNDTDEAMATISLLGVGTPSPLADILVTNNSGSAGDRVVNFDEIEPGQSAAVNVTLTNEGTADLRINDIAATDPLSPPFSITDNPCSSATLSPGDNCTLALQFSPTAAGSFTETFEIQSNDPDEGDIAVTLNGASKDPQNPNAEGDEDNDAVSDEEEDGAANGGDGNNDGTADRLQGHVTSMRTLSGEYVTLVAPSDSRLVDCRMVESPSPNDTPADVIFPQGFFEFTISDMANPDDVTLEIILHSDDVPTNYYKYGPTADNPDDHWYEFLFDDDTGAEINGNIITLHFADAKRGDDVLNADDMIVDIGGPAYKESDPDPATGTGSSSSCFISSIL